MSRHADQVVDKTTNRPIANVQIYVYDSTGALAPLTKDDGTALTNPFNGDIYGNYSFNVSVDNTYRIEYWANFKLVYAEQVIIGFPSVYKGQKGDTGNIGPAGPPGTTPTGTGFPHATGGVLDGAALTPTQVTAQLDVVTPTTKGLAPASGGGTTNFLRADGTFAAPPGVTYSNFNSTTAGLVPASGGGTANFLRADGSFVTPPSSAGGNGGPMETALLFTGIGSATLQSTTTSFWTSGYNTAGVGAARYIYDAAVNSTTVAANPRTQVMNGARGFRLDPTQYLTVTQWGIVADYVSDTNRGTDNYAAIVEMSNFRPDPNRNWSPPVYWPVGLFYSSATIEIQNVVHWIGASNGNNTGGDLNGGGTYLYVPINTLIIRVHSDTTQPSGARSPADAHYSGYGSTFERMAFSQTTRAGTLSTTAHGLQMRGVAIVRDCQFYNIAGNAIHISAAAGYGGFAEGDCNNWVVDNCFVLSCNGDGLNVSGRDANAGNCIGFKTAGITNTGCGIMDNSGLGNYYYAPQITGYGNKGVNYGGRNYQLISVVPGQGSTTTPGTEALPAAVWYELGAQASPSVQFPAWSSSNTYTLQLGIALFGASNTSEVFGAYVEGNATLCHAEHPSTFYGGQIAATDVSNFITSGTGYTAITSGTGFGSSKTTYPGSKLAALIGTGQQAIVGRQNGNGTLDILTFLNGYDDTAPWIWAWVNGDHNLGKQGQKNVWTITGKATALQFGRSVIQPNYMCLLDPVLCDQGAYANGRVISTRSAVPSTSEHAQGEYYFNTASGSGVIGWSCKTGGTPGTFGIDYLNERSANNVGIGYVTGAGGTITQATGKTTAVSLNTVCGQITLNGASLAANTAVSFTFSNTNIATTDVIRVSIASGCATPGSYLVQADGTAAGSCTISLRNLTAGALAEALVLNFVIIKATAA